MGRRASRALRKLADRYRVRDGTKFRIEDHDPGDTAGLTLEGKGEREEAEKRLAEGLRRLAQLQSALYAEDRWGILIVLQAMDAAGKDSIIKHVLSGMNPQGVQVSPFKAPSPDDLNHDFLWRATKRLPERGQIGIFNRSYYEEVLIVRVHPELLERQKLPPDLVDGKIWSSRYEDINAFERYLSRNGFLVLKFFLNVSKKEQRKRFLERLDLREKNWKFSMADVQERRFWSDYQKAYEAAIAATATRWAPWYVVPADHKWFTRIVVAAAIVSEMERLNLAYPKLSPEEKAALAAARRRL